MKPFFFHCGHVIVVVLYYVKCFVKFVLQPRRVNVKVLSNHHVDVICMVFSQTDEINQLKFAGCLSPQISVV